MFKQFYIKTTVLLGLTLFLFACSKETAPMEQEIQTEELASLHNKTFVSQSKATSIAAAFLGTLSHEPATKGNARIASTQTIRDNKSSEPLMYVMNYTDGKYVIVSATKKYYPILAYSDKGNFIITDNMPFGLTIWLEETKAAINYQMYEATEADVQKYGTVWQKYGDINDIFSQIRTKTDPYRLLMDEVSYWSGQGYSISQVGNCGSGVPVDICTSFTAYAEATIYPAYDYLTYSLIVNKGMGSTTTTGPLLTTQWHQEHPFDTQTPNNYPAGCVAVAMAQIMKYHKKPSSYNWNNMPDVEHIYYPTTSDTPQLMKDIGIAVSMKYTPTLSTAKTDSAKIAFQNNYGYHVTKASHKDSDVIHEITVNKRPIYMRGEPLTGGTGHAWVCDGYQSNVSYTEYLLRVPISAGQYGITHSHQQDYTQYMYYHMNWGWVYYPYPGYTNNGWFLYNNVNTSEGDFQKNRENLYVYPN